MENDPFTLNHRYRTFFCSQCGHAHKSPIFCGDRFCPVCSRPRAFRARSRLKQIIGLVHLPKGYSFVHIVLTIPSVAHPDNGHSTLLSSFRRLRQRSFWKRRVLGGACCIEVTGRPDNWHVHLHAIAVARWLPFALLRSAWSKVSPGSIVFLAKIPPRVAANYLTKYFTLSDKNPVPLDLPACSFRSSRLFQTFGVWHRFNLKAKRVPLPCPNCGNSCWIPESILHRFRFDPTVRISIQPRAHPP